MLRKSHEVLDGFLKEFTRRGFYRPEDVNKDRPYVAIETFNGNVDFLVKYFNRSGESSAEDLQEEYPCIVIQDFTPVPNAKYRWGRDWIDGFYDKISGKTEQLFLPVPLLFRFQVTAITRKFSEKSGIIDWFYQHLMPSGVDFFEFNKVASEHGFVADIVPYKVTTNETELTDGRFFINYDFELETFIHFKAKSYTFVSNEVGFSGENFKDALEKISLSLETMSYDSLIKKLETILIIEKNEQ